MSINSFRCRTCDCKLRLDDNWPVHRAKNRHYICDACNKKEQSPKVPNGHGYVYLLRNENHPGRYKIGKSRNPEARCQKFNTACPDRSFSVVRTWYSKNYSKLEADVHFTLHEYRLPGTEWFEGDGENFEAIINALSNARRSHVHAD